MELILMNVCVFLGGQKVPDINKKPKSATNMVSSFGTLLLIDQFSFMHPLGSLLTCKVEIVKIS